MYKNPKYGPGPLTPSRPNIRKSVFPGFLLGKIAFLRVFKVSWVGVYGFPCVILGI